MERRFHCRLLGILESSSDARVTVPLPHSTEAVHMEGDQDPGQLIVTGVLECSELSALNPHPHPAIAPDTILFLCCLTLCGCKKLIHCLIANGRLNKSIVFITLQTKLGLAWGAMWQFSWGLADKPESTQH